MHFGDGGAMLYEVICTAAVGVLTLIAFLLDRLCSGRGQDRPRAEVLPPQEQVGPLRAAEPHTRTAPPPDQTA